jgi:hypothetical protein
LKLRLPNILQTTMLTVAVAGGTSPGLGRAVVKAIEETNELTPIVLTRQSSKIPEWLSDSKVEVRRVDYSSEESCFEALEGVNIVSVHSVISSIHG